MTNDDLLELLAKAGRLTPEQVWWAKNGEIVGIGSIAFKDGRRRQFPQTDGARR